MVCDAQGATPSAWGRLMARSWSSAQSSSRKSSFAKNPCGATYCARLPFTNESLPFHSQRCAGVRFWEEQFSFDEASHFVMSPSVGAHFCLDVVEDGTRVGLRDCDPRSPSQRWGFHGTKLQNGQWGLLVTPAFASDSDHDARLPLIFGELNDTSGPSAWTFVHSSSLGDDSSKPFLPSSRSANLVWNNQFLENSDQAPAEGDPAGMTTLLCRWTILGDSTTMIVRNPDGGNHVILGAISQTVPTHPGLPHTLKFNVKVSGHCDPAAMILASLLPSSSESNEVHIHSNGGLWKAEELRFTAVNSTVNLTFTNIGSKHSSCSVTIGNVEVGLEDDYLIAEAADKLWTRVLYLYALLAFVGVLVLAILVVHVVGSLRNRKRK